MFIAVCAVFILPDLPHNTRGFTEEERYVAQLRMTEDVGVADSDEGQTAFTGLLMAVKDGKVYLMMFTLTAYVVGLSFNAFFVSRALPLLHISHGLLTTTTTTALPHRHSGLLLRPHTAHERAALGVCLRGLGGQRVALGSHPRQGLSCLHPTPVDTKH